jgi:hypothetical protein
MIARVHVVGVVGDDGVSGGKALTTPVSHQPRVTVVSVAAAKNA